MTESEIWLELGKAWSDVVKNPTGKFPWVGPQDAFDRDDWSGEAGLCDSLIARFRSTSFYLTATSRLRLFAPSDVSSCGEYWWKLTPNGSVQRVWVCCFLAAMAEDGV